MKSEAQEALGRLKEKLQGRKITHEKDGQFLTTSMVGVSAADVIALCEELPSTPRTDALKGGSLNVIEATKQIDQVAAIQLIDLQYLVKQAESPDKAPVMKPVAPFQKPPPVE